MEMIAHDYVTATSTATASPNYSWGSQEGTTATRHTGTEHLSKFEIHDATAPANEGAEDMTTFTAANLVTYISSLTVPQLRAVRDAIDKRIAEVEDGALMREIVADQKLNPNTHGLPHGLTDWSPTRMAIHDNIQEAKAAERAAAAAERTAEGSTH
jgi:hypothetical protein